MSVCYGLDETCRRFSIKRKFASFFNKDCSNCSLEDDKARPILLIYKQIDADSAWKMSIKNSEDLRYEAKKVSQELKSRKLELRKLALESRRPHCYEDCVYPVEFSLSVSPALRRNTKSALNSSNIHQNADRTLSVHFQKWIYYRAKFTRIQLNTRKRIPRCTCVYKYSRKFKKTFSICSTLKSIKEEEESTFAEARNFEEIIENGSKQIEEDCEQDLNISGIRNFLKKLFRRFKRRKVEETATYVSFTNF